VSTDYPDWGALAALQTFITNLNLASQTLQATATEIAAEIEATGIPLLGNPAQVYAATSVNVPAGAANQVIDNAAGGGVAAMAGYLSYDIAITVSPNASSAAPFLTVRLAWYAQSGGTILLYDEQWTVPASTASGGMLVCGTGPVRGAYLQITVTNEDGTYAQTLNTLYLYGNSRPAPEPEPDWRNTTITAAVPGYTVAAGGGNTDGIIGFFTATLAASGTATLLCGLYNGPALVAVIVAGTSPDLLVQPQWYLSGFGLRRLDQSYNIGTEALSESFTVNCPRSPLVLSLTNDNASDSVTYVITVVAAPTR